MLATERLKPSTMPAPSPHPQSHAIAMPSGVASAIWPIAPGTATPRTASRSEAEKCRPTPNISRMTPISASCPASSPSATNPGVKGPIMMPATRKPTSGGSRNRSAAYPNAEANTKQVAIVAISVTWWSIPVPWLPAVPILSMHHTSAGRKVAAPPSTGNRGPMAGATAARRARTARRCLDIGAARPDFLSAGREWLRTPCRETS